MIPFHVVSGMNGAVMVRPRDGLKDRHGNPLRYDRAYYVGEQDFYVPRDADGESSTTPTTARAWPTCSTSCKRSRPPMSC